MQVSIYEKCRAFQGEDGDTLEVRYAGDDPYAQVQLAVTEGFSGERITATLNSAEAALVRLHMAVALSDNATRYNRFELGEQVDGPYLSVIRTNRGEPYREGLEVTVAYDYQHSGSVFLEHGEAAGLHRLLKDMSRVDANDAARS